MIDIFNKKGSILYLQYQIADSWGCTDIARKYLLDAEKAGNSLAKSKLLGEKLEKTVDERTFLALHNKLKRLEAKNGMRSCSYADHQALLSTFLSEEEKVKIMSNTMDTILLRCLSYRLYNGQEMHGINIPKDKTKAAFYYALATELDRYLYTFLHMPFLGKMVAKTKLIVLGQQYFLEKIAKENQKSEEQHPISYKPNHTTKEVMESILLFKLKKLDPLAHIELAKVCNKTLAPH